MTMTEAVPQNLALNDIHVGLGAKMGDFGGWNVPLYYSSIIEEHMAVRTAAGLFDISHMGEFFFEGPEALPALESIFPRKIASMNMGQAFYMPLLNDAGGLVDDVILYRLEDEKFLLIVNAGNVDKDRAWIQSKFQNPALLQDRSEEFGLLALQGPKAAIILEEAFGQFYKDLKNYHATAFEGGVIARTGYTGEDGFEIMVLKDKLPGIWDTLFRVGKKNGLLPAGFGARDTLRLEAAMPLYGHELSDEITALEAGIGWTLDFEKADFPAKELLAAQKAEGLKQKRIGFELVGRGVVREHYEVQKDGKRIGEVTSGSFIPTTKKSIGMAYIDQRLKTKDSRPLCVGDEIEVLIRDKPVKAKIVKLPFYKRET